MTSRWPKPCSPVVSAPTPAMSYSTEPPAADHPILSAPNTFVTPHIAWATAAARGRIVRIMADNLKAFLAGVPRKRGVVERAMLIEGLELRRDSHLRIVS